MKIFVCIKQVPDTETKITSIADANKAPLENVKWVINPYDEFAIEEALKLRESAGGEVTVLSVGPARISESLRTALAMGADKAIAVDAPETLDSLVTAKALAKVLEAAAPDIVFTGKMAIDDNMSSVHTMLAALLGFPHVTNVTSFEKQNDSVKVSCQQDGGAQEIVEAKLPCVVGATKGLNSPRYASLPGIMKAKKKPLEQKTLSDLGLNESENKVIFKNYSLPPQKNPVQMFEGEPQEQAKKLVDALRNQSKVI